MDEFRIDFVNEDGTLKDKEQFIKELSEVYDQAEQAIMLEEDVPNFMSLFTSQENAFEPEQLISRYQFAERKIYLNDEITDGVSREDGGSNMILPLMSQDTGRSILERIQYWNSEDAFNGTPVEERIPIQIYIDTPGGSLTTTLQIVDAIKSSKTPVYTIVTGTAYSGGFFIAMAGHKRLAYPNSTFLFHEGCGGAYGDAHKARQGMKFYEMLLDKIKNHVLSSTNISKELYEKHEKDDWYFDAEKAVKLGVIDEITYDVNGGLFDYEE